MAHLAAGAQQAKRHRTGMVQNHVNGLGELRGRVPHEGDHGADDPLIHGPRVHNGTVVYAVNQHLIDSLRLERILRLKVSGNLLRGSCGRERARKTNDDGLLAGQALTHVDLLRREAEVELDGRDLVAGSDLPTHERTCRTRGESNPLGLARLHSRGMLNLDLPSTVPTLGSPGPFEGARGCGKQQPWIASEQ